MRGGFCHNHLLLRPLRDRFRGAGAVVSEEHPVWREGRLIGYVDLWVVYGAWRLACEAERDRRRLRQDVAKAAALEATALLIVVPTGVLARSVRWKLAEVLPPGPPPFAIEVWPLGAALRELARFCPLISRENVQRTIGQKITLRSERGPTVTPAERS